MKYYLNIGTNLGDREQNLLRAIAALNEGSSGCCLVSRIVKSEPWGFVSPHSFLNVGVAVQVEKSPHEMLQWIHEIESRLGSANHRDANGNYVDRLVDIDIMSIDDNHGNPVVVNAPTLQVPHPHLQDRFFFSHTMEDLKRWK